MYLESWDEDFQAHFVAGEHPSPVFVYDVAAALVADRTINAAWTTYQVGLGSLVAETLTLEQSFGDVYGGGCPLQFLQTVGLTSHFGGTAGRFGDRTSAQRVAAVCRS